MAFKMEWPCLPLRVIFRAVLYETDIEFESHQEMTALARRVFCF